MSSDSTLPLPVGMAVSISETTLGRQGEQQVVVLAGGQSVAIWHTATATGNFYEIYGRLLDAAGQPVGPEFLVNTTRALDQFLPEVTALADGGFVVVWHSVEYADEVAFNGNPFLYTLFSQRFAADGSPVGSEQTISINEYSDPYGVDVVALAGGGHVVIWEQFGVIDGATSEDGYFRVYGADGLPVGPPVRPEPFVAGPELGSEVVALAGGGFAIMKYHMDAAQWGSSAFEVRVYSAAGVQIGTPFLVSNAVQEEFEMRLVALTGGGFLVTWTANEPNEFGHIFARVFGADGTPIGDNLRIDAPTAIRSFSSQAVALESGGFVVAWTEGRSDPPGYQHMAQVFSATGLAISAPQTVGFFENNFGSYDPLHSLHELPGGEILITWQGRFGLYGRLMETDGRLHPGTVMLVPAFYLASNIEVTVLADGRIAISFESSFGGEYADIQDVQVLTIELNPSGGLQGGYTEGADSRQLLGASALVYALGGDDVVLAGANGDTVYGGQGHDYLVGEIADDQLFGDAGNDTLDAGMAPDNDQSPADQLYGGTGDDLLISTRGADSLYGGEGNDTFLGLGFGYGKRVYGDEGDDLIRVSADVIYGGAGNDTISVGAPVIEGGEGSDTLLYEYEVREDYPHLGSFISIDLNGSVTIEAYTHIQISGFENVQISGFVDSTIAGNALDNRIETDSGANSRGTDRLQGRDGNDTLIAGGGHDTLDGGVGADWLYGGEGFDLASYVGALAGVRVDLVNTSDRGGEAIGDQLFGIEGLVGSAHSDFLAGTNLANWLEGGAGNDGLFGLAGNDMIYGGAGNDVLIGGLGADSLMGDAGTRDRVQYTDAATGLRADLLAPAFNTGNAVGDTYSGVEDIFGSFQGDTLLGDFGANIIWGAGGNDPWLDGRAGDDSLFGGEGNDVLIGGRDADLLDGGNGTRDRAQYTDSAGIRADIQVPGFNTGFAAGDTYVGIEDIYGSFQSDTLLGDGGGNIIWGATGNDVIDGRIGNDTILGGAGNDTISGGAGADVFIFESAIGAANVDSLTGYSVTDDIIHLENAVFAALTTTGALAFGAFAIGASATAAAHRIIYNATTGQLLYDADGNGGGAAIHFATLFVGLAMTEGEFLVV